MGCGCHKNTNNRKARRLAAEKKVQRERLAATKDYRKDKAKRRKLVEIKLQFCKTCPHSIPTSEERRRKAKVCHKNSISIQAILNKPKYKCPIGNF